MIASNRLYLFSMDGTCAVISLDGQEGKVEKTKKLGDEVLGSPAVSGDAMYVRGAQNLWKISAK